MKKVLLTCFEPFDNREKNVSMEVTEVIIDNKDKLSNNGYSVDLIYLPVSWNNSFIKLKDIISEYDYILLCGEANGRKNVLMEYVAINLMHASIPDNDGLILENKKISENQNAFFSNIDLFSLSKKINIGVSLTAGSYLCNYIYYKTLETIHMNKLDTKCMFIHFPVPYIELYKQSLKSIILSL